MRTVTAPFFFLGLSLAACTKAPVDVELKFNAVVGTDAARCGEDYTVGSPAVTAQLADARLFLSKLELRASDGSWVPLTLEETSWQMQDLALLDFEDGSAGCADSGTTEMNNSITGTLATDTYDAVRFDVGVPFEHNHNDTATAPAPLNSPGMFWTWQGGYKFVRVDFSMPSSRWNVHLGSTGCVSDSPVDAPAAPCGHSNLSTVTVELDPMTETIQLDLAALVARTDVSSNTMDTPPGCQSHPMEPGDCTEAFDALGLDFSTGDCTSDCSDQAVFGRTP